MIAPDSKLPSSGEGKWQALQTGASLVLWRGLGVAVGAIGGIWVARTLGPEKLGISTFLLGLLGLGGVLTSLNQDYNFVRRGKALPPGSSLDELVDQVFSLRFGLGVILAAIAFLALLIWRPDPVWYLPAGVGLVMLVLQSNDAGWILQLRNRMPRFFVALSLQSIVTGSLCIAFIRSDWPAGSDLAFALAGNALGFWLIWRWACGGPIRIRVSFSNFLAGLQLLRGGPWLALMGLGMYLVGSAEVLLIGALASVEDLGIYRTAMQFINVINPFVPLFFYRLYPQLIELQQDDPTAVLGAQFAAFGRVVLFGLPLVIGAFLLAPYVYPLVFGEAFASAALPFAILFTAKVVAVGVNVFMWGALARHLDRSVVLLLLGTSVVTLGLNFLLIPQIGMVAAAGVNLLAQLILLAGNVAFMFHSNRHLRRISLS